MKILVFIAAFLLSTYLQSQEITWVSSTNIDTPFTLEMPVQVRWPEAVLVYYNPSGSSLWEGETDYLIEYSVWSWNTRTGSDIIYKGYTNLYEIEGAVVVRWLSRKEIAEITNSFSTLGVAQVTHTSTEIKKATISLNSYWFLGRADSCAAHTIIHEIGHTLGILSHSPNSHDIMAAFRGNCRYSLSPGDTLLAPYPEAQKNYCYTELTPRKGLYIPSIIMQSAELRFEREFDWVIMEQANSFSNCSGHVTSEGVFLYNVKSFDLGEYNNVRLGEKRLPNNYGTYWSLIYAE